MIKCSIIVPVYNVEKYIVRCLESVAAQTYGAIECVIVNDCTPDSSFEKARQFVAEHQAACPNVEFRLTEHTVNKGLSEARNTGVRMATGHYVYFLDSDDAITPMAMASMMAVAEEGGMPDMVYADTVTIDAEGRRNSLDPGAEHPSMANNRDILHGVLTDQWPRIACNKLVRRTIFTDDGKWFAPGLLHEDELWTFEVATVMNKMLYCPEVTYLYYTGDTNSIVRGGFNVRHITSNITILDKKADYISKVSLPEEVAQHVYNLAHLLYLSIVLNKQSRPDRRTYRRQLKAIIKKVRQSGSWHLTTPWYARVAWLLAW